MNNNKNSNGKTHSVETILSHAGRHPEENHGFVNTPVTRGSTILFGTLEELDSGTQPFRYGRTGNPSTQSVEEIITELEGAEGTVLAPSGLAAITTALLSCLKSGDELLMTDSAYEPTRRLCEGLLKNLGITTIYYDPRAGADIEKLITAQTRAIFLESPGSLTFEIQDLPAIAEVAHKKDITVLIDNSWATPLFQRPLDLGADIVIHAGTKMFVGHSDAMFGTISANKRALPSLTSTHRYMGICASPDDAFLAARGLRTLALRMKAHQENALELATWLEVQPNVRSVLHPALPSHPDHAIFKRDFSGSGSLFSFILDDAPRSALAAMLDDLELFGMGYSWGGYESLVLPVTPNRIRSAVPWTEKGTVLRIHTGLENVADLKADFGAGLERYRKAMD